MDEVHPPGYAFEGIFEEYGRIITNEKWFCYCRNLGIPPSDIHRWKMSTLREEEKYHMLQEAFRKDRHGASGRVQRFFGLQNALVWDDGGELDDVTVYGIIDAIPKDEWPRFARLVLGVRHARFSAFNLTEEQKVLMLKKWAFDQHQSVDIRARLEEAYRSLGLQGPINVENITLNTENVHVDS